MAVAGHSVVANFAPVTCCNCFLTYGDFWQTYCGQIEKIVEWCQRHGLILTEKDSVRIVEVGVG